MAKKLSELNLCGRLLRNPDTIDKLRSYFVISQGIEQEIAAAICENKKRGTWTELLSSEGQYVTDDPRGAYWEVEYDDTDACRGGKMVGHIHSHPQGDKWFSEDDLHTVNEYGTGCILYRRKNDLRIRCASRLGRKRTDKYMEEIFKGNPADYFPILCDRKVTGKGVKRWRWPWKQF